MQKRSIRIAGHSTSISLEPEFWAELKRMADEDDVSLNHFVAQVDRARSGNLSSALRVLVLMRLKKAELRSRV